MLRVGVWGRDGSRIFSDRRLADCSIFRSIFRGRKLQKTLDFVDFLLFSGDGKIIDFGEVFGEVFEPIF